MHCPIWVVLQYVTEETFRFVNLESFNKIKRLWDVENLAFNGKMTQVKKLEENANRS